MTDYDPTRRIEELEARRAAALMAADVAALGAMTHEAYVHIDARGALRDRRSYLASVETAAVRIVESRMTDSRIVIVDRTAIATGLFANDIRTPAGKERREGRYVRTYVCVEGTWLNISHQATEFTANPQ